MRKDVAFPIRRYIVKHGRVSNDLLFECGKHLVRLGYGASLSVGNYIRSFEIEFERSNHQPYEIDDVDDSVKLHLV